MAAGPTLRGQRVLVTGGAGFIGSHAVEALLKEGAKVTVLDHHRPPAGNLASVTSTIEYVQADCADPKALDRVLPGHSSVWHFAADPDVRAGAADPAKQLRANFESTLGLLEGMRRHKVADFVFTSTSAVYGRASVRPTPESYGPLAPVSAYGASKLANEAAIAAYCELVPMRAVMFRFANVVGPRAGHGVIPDFVRKLRADGKELEVLGDGTQAKSYVSVEDTVAGMIHASTRAGPGCSVFNIGSRDTVTVKELAKIVAGANGLSPKLRFAGGAADGAGWKGDVKAMALDTSRLEGLGWKPKHTSAQAIEIAAKAAWATK